MADRSSRVTTWVLERALATGATTWAPVVEPALCAFGDDEVPADELAVFLADLLATARPAAAARYFLPAGVEVRSIEVALDPGAPTRPRGPRPIAVTCVLIPHGPEGKDRWGLVPVLGAAFFVDRREPVEEVAAREIARLAAASGLDGSDWRRLLPPLLRDDRAAFAQGRWSFENERQGLLTRLQALIQNHIWTMNTQLMIVTLPFDEKQEEAQRLGDEVHKFIRQEVLPKLRPDEPLPKLIGPMYLGCSSRQEILSRYEQRSGDKPFPGEPGPKKERTIVWAFLIDCLKREQAK